MDRNSSVIIIIANTTLGQRGSIGERYSHILDTHPNFIFLGRGSFCHTDKSYGLPFIGFLAKSISAFRRYFFPILNARIIDIFLFEIGFLIFHVPIILFYRSRISVALLQEFSYSAVWILKILQIRFVFDLSIAPESYAIDFCQKFGLGMGVEPNYMVYKRQKNILPLCDHVICPSKFVSDWLSSLYTSKSTIIHFGANPSSYQANISSDSVELQDLNFIFFGVLSNRKGIDILMQSWIDFDDKAKLHLCGKMPLSTSQKLPQYGFNNVITPGFVDCEFYTSSLCGQVVYVFPSLLEGSSKSIYTAMSLGLPVICTPESGSIVQHNYTGILIDKMSTVSLSSAMALYFKRRDLIVEHGHNAISAVKSYSWERYSKNVLNLLESI